MAKIKVGGGLGFVMLLVVVVVVMLLASRAWKEATPTVMQLNGAKTAVADHGQPEAREALGTLPDLNDMRQSTGAHAEELSKALAETE